MIGTSLIVLAIVAILLAVVAFERWEKRRQDRIVEAARRRGRRVMFR